MFNTTHNNGLLLLNNNNNNNNIYHIISNVYVPCVSTILHEAYLYIHNPLL